MRLKLAFLTALSVWPIAAQAQSVQDLSLPQLYVARQNLRRQAASCNSQFQNYAQAAQQQAYRNAMGGGFGFVQQPSCQANDPRLISKMQAVEVEIARRETGDQRSSCEISNMCRQPGYRPGYGPEMHNIQNGEITTPSGNTVYNDGFNYHWVCGPNGAVYGSNSYNLPYPNCRPL